MLSYDSDWLAVMHWAKRPVYFHDAPHGRNMGNGSLALIRPVRCGKQTDGDEEKFKHRCKENDNKQENQLRKRRNVASVEWRCCWGLASRLVSAHHIHPIGCFDALHRIYPLMASWDERNDSIQLLCLNAGCAMICKVEWSRLKSNLLVSREWGAWLLLFWAQVLLNLSLFIQNSNRHYWLDMENFSYSKLIIPTFMRYKLSKPFLNNAL